MREHVTMNSGTEGGGNETRVGAHCLLLTAAHVAHDCQVGDHVSLSTTRRSAGTSRRRPRHPWRAVRGASIRAHRRARLYRRHVREKERCDPFRHGARQPRDACGLKSSASSATASSASRSTRSGRPTGCCSPARERCRSGSRTSTTCSRGTACQADHRVHQDPIRPLVLRAQQCRDAEPMTQPR